MLHHKDDLMCDLAEYYGIIDMEALSVSTLAGLSCGLPPDSRTMMRMSGQKVPLNTMLLANIADRLGILIWMNTEDAKHGRNRPPSILSELLTDKKENKIKNYNTGAEFEAARLKILGREENT